eukprot:GHVL01024535.1.p1 GENE.GHVL01024535.1~~GHVL01024535.1.p1  ORF type:complete len:844 (-),score=224.60 GHVL01024535.1:38-2569(-)
MPLFWGKKDSKTDSEEWMSDVAHEYPYTELVVSTDNFAERNVLGKGAFGCVYRGVLRNQTEIAIKQLCAPEQSGFEDEVRVLSKFRHPNLVTLMGYAKNENERFLVYELLSGGDVSSRLTKKGHDFTWDKRLYVALDAVTGLSHLHNCHPKVFHRDIKSANILMDRNGTAKMADFGLASVSAKHENGEMTVEKAEGTPGYADPNYIKTLIVSEKTEVYSFVDQSTGWPDGVPERLGELALRCIDPDELNRPDSTGIVESLRNLIQEFKDRPAMQQRQMPQYGPPHPQHAPQFCAPHGHHHGPPFGGPPPPSQFLWDGGGQQLMGIPPAQQHPGQAPPPFHHLIGPQQPGAPPPRSKSAAITPRSEYGNFYASPSVFHPQQPPPPVGAIMLVQERHHPQHFNMGFHPQNIIQHQQEPNEVSKRRSGNIKPPTSSNNMKQLYVLQVIGTYSADIPEVARNITHAKWCDNSDHRAPDTLVIGRAHPLFSDYYEERIPTGWYGCISREHFSIRTVVDSDRGRKKDRRVRFEIMGLSNNGTHVFCNKNDHNDEILLKQDTSVLRSGDEIGIVVNDGEIIFGFKFIVGDLHSNERNSQECKPAPYVSSIGGASKRKSRISNPIDLEKNKNNIDLEKNKNNIDFEKNRNNIQDEKNRNNIQDEKNRNNIQDEKKDIVTPHRGDAEPLNHASIDVKDQSSDTVCRPGISVRTNTIAKTTSTQVAPRSEQLRARTFNQNDTQVRSTDILNRSETSENISKVNERKGIWASITGLCKGNKQIPVSNIDDKMNRETEVTVVTTSASAVLSPHSGEMTEFMKEFMKENSSDEQRRSFTSHRPASVLAPPVEIDEK